MNLLKFGLPNAKLKKLAKKLKLKLKTFSLPSGWTVPAQKNVIRVQTVRRGKLKTASTQNFVASKLVPKQFIRH